MKFTPQAAINPAQQPTQYKPLDPGVYDFEIGPVKEGKSKAGNDMLTVELWIYTGPDEYKKVWDYILPDLAMWKLETLCASIGQPELYKSGDIEPYDLQGKTGRVSIGIQKGTTEYPNDKNIVKKYLSRDAKGEELNDEIPF